MREQRGQQAPRLLACMIGLREWVCGWLGQAGAGGLGMGSGLISVV